MFTAHTYEEIERNERAIGDKHIVILLFVRPSLQGADEIIDEFDYLHYNSSRYCSIYAVGYTNDNGVSGDPEYKKVKGVSGADWYYSNKAFVAFKNNLEHRLSWRYSGEIEILVLQSNPDGKQILNFQNYIAIDVNYGIRSEYIDSFPRFMESLIRSSKSEVTAVSAMSCVKQNRYSVKNILTCSIEECKKIPKPVKVILKDRLFFLPSRSPK